MIGTYVRSCDYGGGTDNKGGGAERRGKERRPRPDLFASTRMMDADGVIFGVHTVVVYYVVAALPL